MSYFQILFFSSDEEMTSVANAVTTEKKKSKSTWVLHVLHDYLLSLITVYLWLSKGIFN